MGILYNHTIISSVLYSTEYIMCYNNIMYVISVQIAQQNVTLVGTI